MDTRVDIAGTVVVVGGVGMGVRGIVVLVQEQGEGDMEEEEGWMMRRRGFRIMRRRLGIRGWVWGLGLVREWERGRRGMRRGL